MPESHPTTSPNSSAAHEFRAYPANSSQAKARLIALALLVDGHLDDRELDDLARRQAFTKLGLSRDPFFQVLYDFCADAATTPNRDDHYLLGSGILASMLAEITDPVQRKTLLRQIFDVIRSDGRLDPGEAHLFWNVVDAWQREGTESVENLRPKKLRRRRWSSRPVD